MIVYVVFGSEGEYSSREVYPIAGYHSEEFAKAHVECAERVIDEVEAAGGEAINRSDWRALGGPVTASLTAVLAENPYDNRPPALHHVLDGQVSYWYSAIPIRETVPAPDDAPAAPLAQGGEDGPQ